MGEVVPFLRAAEGDLYDRLSERYNGKLEESRRLSEQLREIERRFVEDDLSVRSGPRKGQPLTRRGRANLMERLVALHQHHAWLLDEQSWLYRVCTGATRG